MTFPIKIVSKLSFISANRYYHIGTASSVHKAIRRGLVKSRGLAFRGKTNPDPDDPREKYKRKHTLPEFDQSPRGYIKRNHDDGNSNPRWDREGERPTHGRNDSRYLQRGRGAIRPTSIGEAPNIWGDRSSLTKSLRETMKNEMDQEKGPEDSDDMSYSALKPYESNGPAEESLEENYSRKLVLTEAPLELKKEFGSSGEDEVPKPFNRSSISEDKNILEFMEDSQREYKKPSFSDSSESTGRGFVSASILNKLPISIPYTTSASEFLYGASVVEAILKPSTEIQRKLYKLYVYKGMYREDIGRDQRLQRLAEDRGVKVERVGNDWIRTLDKMSSGRPHNGYILEASPLPKLPVKGLGDVKISEDANGNKQAGFEVQLDHQTREDEAINGTSNIVKIQKSLHDKQPIVLLLDQILDPGNLGGIIRTASFLGISAIAIATRNCASMTPIVSKASAGASESMKILSVESPNEFVLNSKKNGWYIYAAVAPSQINNSIGTREILPLEKLVAEDSLPNLPSIIMMGGEGEGLRRALRNKANVQVSILGHQEPGIESLNVTVATETLSKCFTEKQQGEYRIQGDPRAQ
ncbi:rRNA methyltransferase 1, mitochondrial [Golovinomyces cichoracearum]|uniref:rRNA methyltransferase 1, mitochondrial n=1 Tax=Golovinomyces cichoracearum TaxID=62708 RepID=A0A420I767_9PEZI|nr:rRNA methyltransferase 1, mitochondrial [Golovinomyces cichoracearum]